jgi:hypothetical protein
MNPEATKIIEPKISEFEAKERLTKGNRFSFGSLTLQKLELVYIPHYIFALELTTRNGLRKVMISVDGIMGSFAVFNLENVQFSQQALSETFEFVLPEAEARERALFEYRRVLLGYSLKRHDLVSVNKIIDCHYVHYPFWVGYFLKRNRYDFAAIDGLSGQKQGVKMRKVFLMAFAQNKDDVSKSSESI